MVLPLEFTCLTGLRDLDLGGCDSLEFPLETLGGLNALSSLQCLDLGLCSSAQARYLRLVFNGLVQKIVWYAQTDGTLVQCMHNCLELLHCIVAGCRKFIKTSKLYCLNRTVIYLLALATRYSSEVSILMSHCFAYDQSRSMPTASPCVS